MSRRYADRPEDAETFTDIQMGTMSKERGPAGGRGRCGFRVSYLYQGVSSHTW